MQGGMGCYGSPLPALWRINFLGVGKNRKLDLKFTPGFYPLYKLLKVLRLVILSSLLTLEINFLVFSSPESAQIDLEISGPDPFSSSLDLWTSLKSP